MRIYILHGWSIDARNEEKWKKFRSILQKNGVESTFLSIPGLSTPLEHVWNLNDYVEWLRDSLHPQINEPVIILGHSFGGQIALKFTSKYQEKVEHLILIDSAGIRDLSFFARWKRTIFARVATLGKFLTTAVWARALLYKLARSRDYFEASELLRQTMSNVIKEDLRSDLSKIDTPCTIIWGKDDMVTPEWMARVLHKRLSHSTLNFIEQARHSPQFTHPQQVVEIIVKKINEEGSE